MHKRTCSLKPMLFSYFKLKQCFHVSCRSINYGRLKKRFDAFFIVGRRNSYSGLLVVLSAVCAFFLLLLISNFIFWKGNRIYEDVLLQSSKKPLILKESDLGQCLLLDCNADISNVIVKVSDRDEEMLMPIELYKKYLARKFVRNLRVQPVEWTHDKLRLLRNVSSNLPRKRLRTPKELIDIEYLREHIEELRKERLLQGDDDIFKIPEVWEEVNQLDFKVPNLIHFIYFSSKPWRFRVNHYIAFIGAFRFQRPRCILLHHNGGLPYGKYWEAAKGILGPILKLVKRSAPSEIFGAPIEPVEHKSDVSRLQLLLEVGGIYLDLDSVILKNLDIFRKNDVTMGISEPTAVCNGIVIASRNAWFLYRWYNEYRYYRFFHIRDWGWNSVLVTYEIAMRFPKTIDLHDGDICRPGWGEEKWLYLKLFNWDYIYITHLSLRRMHKSKFDGPERSLKELAVLNNTYGEMARHAIWGDKNIRNITDWIVTCNMTQFLLMGEPLPSVYS